MNGDAAEQLLLLDLNVSRLHQLQNHKKRDDHLITGSLLLQKRPEIRVAVCVQICLDVELLAVGSTSSFSLLPN